jgi:hypothetical protein
VAIDGGGAVVALAVFGFVRGRRRSWPSLICSTSDRVRKPKSETGHDLVRCYDILHICSLFSVNALSWLISIHSSMLHLTSSSSLSQAATYTARAGRQHRPRDRRRHQLLCLPRYACQTAPSSILATLSIKARSCAHR